VVIIEGKDEDQFINTSGGVAERESSKMKAMSTRSVMPHPIEIRMPFTRALGAQIRARCGLSELVVGIWPLEIVQGDAPADVRERVLSWTSQHQQELLAAWRRGRRGSGARRLAWPGVIPPLSASQRV
jgi:hypothetical protein